MASETLECAHNACRCMVSSSLDDAGSDPLPAYCTDYCRNEAENREEHDVCDCGHPPCDSP
ncbi:MAG: hypothetical protein GIW95_09910 [Candidatus Eremiobacteraeota bacterium]|nr:hypothetical protein [Candidatus Eremiobacteraeota bacterium]